MSLGFQKAGFNILAGFEHWDTAILCYKRNFKHPVEDIDLSNEEHAIEIITKYNPDIIIGGPPCQDFSGAGKRIEGERANLTISYAKIVSKILPKYFVMENVERVTNSNAYKEARNIFKEAGYGLTEKVLDASFCGVPQKRKRFFCIGQKNGMDGFLDVLLSTNQSIFPMTVREYFENQNYDITIEYYYRHPRSYQRRGIFSIDEPSPTIRGVNRPKPIKYLKHKGDPCDPEGIRNLSFLERALIQTFPENFIWDDSPYLTEQMIGNAVPVNLARYVASCLLRFFKGDVDTLNIRFIDWLRKEKKLSREVAGDTLSRVGCAKKIQAFGNDDCDDYINKLENNKIFQDINPSVRAQIRRSLRLYFEYLKYNKEPEI